MNLPFFICFFILFAESFTKHQSACIFCSSYTAAHNRRHTSSVLPMLWNTLRSGGRPGQKATVPQPRWLIRSVGFNLWINLWTFKCAQKKSFFGISVNIHPKISTVHCAKKGQRNILKKRERIYICNIYIYTFQHLHNVKLLLSLLLKSSNIAFLPAQITTLIITSLRSYIIIPHIVTLY